MKTFNDVGGLLFNQRWIFAKTMPHNPHEYTLRKNWNNDSDFATVVQYIRDNGYQGSFGGHQYTYLNANGFYHWTMGAPINETILINRKPIEYKSPYDQIADKYDSVFSDEKSKQEDSEVMRMIGDVSSKSVLDIGCGTGLFLQYQSPMFYRGVDPSQRMLDHLSDKYPSLRGTTIRTTFADFADGRKYNRIIALYGVASYLTAQDIQRCKTLLTADGEAFLMFYSREYHPVIYQQTGVNAHPQTFADNTPYPAIRFHNYDIIRFGGGDE